MEKHSDMEYDFGQPDHEDDNGYYIYLLKPQTHIIDTDECNGNIVTYEFPFRQGAFDNYVVWHTTLN